MLIAMLPADELDRLENADAVFDLRMLGKVQEAWMLHHGIDAPKSSGSRKPSISRRVK
jgi:hypothetical protein